MRGDDTGGQEGRALTIPYLSRPNLQTALLINQAPMALFAAGIVIVTVGLLIGISDYSATLSASLQGGTFTTADIDAVAGGIRTVWLASLVAFLMFLAAVSMLSLWVYRRVAHRLDEVVSYAERRLAD